VTLVGDVERMCRVEGLPGAEVVVPAGDLMRIGVVALVRIPHSRGGCIVVGDGMRCCYLEMSRRTRGWRILGYGDPLVQVLRGRRAELEDLRAEVAAVLGTS
jgi:hypothetical protein